MGGGGGGRVGGGSIHTTRQSANHARALPVDNELLHVQLMFLTFLSKWRQLLRSVLSNLIINYIR